MNDDILSKLVAMSRYLGDPANGHAILGEGNTSAKIDDDTFYVKASGTTLTGIEPGAFVTVSISKVVAILDDRKANDETVTQVFREALVDPAEKRRPSVEAMLHAILLQVPEFRFVGHTHPAHVLMVLCSNRAKEAATTRLFPDQVVSLAHRSVYVPYVDPGLVLAREVRRRFLEFVDHEGELPRAIFMQNHGMITMGDSPQAVTSCTDMAEKAAKVLLGTYLLGGPRFMTPKDVERIHTRPDEAYRLKIIADSNTGDSD